MRQQSSGSRRRASIAGCALAAVLAGACAGGSRTAIPEPHLPPAAPRTLSHLDRVDARPPGLRSDVSGRVQLTDGSPPSALEPIVVLLVPGDRSVRERSDTAPATVLRSDGNEFSLPFSLALAGAEIRFENGGTLEHELFTSALDGVRVRIPANQTSTGIRLPAGPARFYCSLHPDETFQIFASRTPHTVIADSAGAFRVPGVPQGGYALEIWSPAVAGPVRTVYVTAWHPRPRVVWLDPRLIASRGAGG